MLIQYVGFIVSRGSRSYNFRVIDRPGEEREFTINVALESFRLTALKFQDGPDLCFARLKRELADEAVTPQAKTAVIISEQDIQIYIEHQYPRKGTHKKARVAVEHA
jgi:hypothetical protein